MNWLTMQRQLNAVLDCAAARGDDPFRDMQIELMGVGNDTDADFPAIYADLFGKQTFDNSDGGWGYDYLTSFGLPEFGG